MADSKLTALTEDTAPTGDDIVYVVNDPAGTPASRKVKLSNLRNSFTTTATAAGTTTLTVNSNINQEFTGATTQTVVLPVVTTLTVGQTFHILNNSTGALTVNSSGGNLVKTVPAGATLTIVCVLVTGTTAASWDATITLILDAGTYTPTLTNTTNIAASTAYLTMYSRVGNVVTVAGEVDIDPTAAGTCVLRMSLPFATTFSAAYQLGGAGNRFISGGPTEGIMIYSRAGGINVAEFALTAVNTANQQCNFSFTYLII